MSELDKLLKDLEEKARAATPGPWHNFAYNRQIRADSSLYPKHPDAKDWVIARYPMRTDNYPISHKEYAANAEHIAAANPDTIKKLIEVIKAMKKSLEYYSEVNKINNGIYLMCDAENTLKDCEKIIKNDS